MPLSRPRNRTMRAALARSGNQCAYPSCSNIIFDNGGMKGQLSHIKGRRPGSARHDASQSPEERHGEANLITMCDEHGILIDSKENIATYTVEILEQMKSDHEQMVEERADRNWIRPPNSISGGAVGDTSVHFWIDRNNHPQVYSDIQLAKLNGLLRLNIDISQLSTLMQALKTIDEPIVHSLLQQDYARVGEGEENLVAHIVKLMAVAPEVTFGEFLNFIIEGGDATPIVNEGAQRLLDIVEGRESSWWIQKKPES